jgi:hypothetical protein
MILTRVPEGLLVVRQTDHGSQTGLFATAWGNEVVAPPSGPDDSILAARHHDDGWAVWERRPSIDHDTGQPVQFLALTPVEHVPLYRAAIDRAAQHSPWVGLLVSMHGAGLYNDRYGTFRLAERCFNAEEQALVDEFLADMEALQDRLALVAGHGSFGPGNHACDDPEVRARYLLLQVWDRLSLQYVFRLAGDGTIGPLPLAGAGAIGPLALAGAEAIRPLPLAGAGAVGPLPLAGAGAVGPLPLAGAEATALTCRHDGSFGLTLDPYPFRDDRMSFPVQACVVADRAYRSPEDFLEAVADAPATTIECRARSV